MLQVPSEAFQRVSHLFDPSMPNSTVLFSTLEQKTPGRVFVNDIQRPQRAIVVANYRGWTFLGGMYDQSSLDHDLAMLQRMTAFELIWPAWLGDHLAPVARFAGVIERCEFFDRQPGTDITPLLPPGSTFRFMDTDLFARCLWYDVVVPAAGTAANFLANCVGVCLIRGDDILCEAYGIFRGAGRQEIGIITHPAHRRQGYAVRTSERLITHCEAQGIVAYWSCDGSNTGSIKTAHGLGFKTQRAYRQFRYEHTP